MKIAAPKIGDVPAEIMRGDLGGFRAFTRPFLRRPVGEGRQVKLMLRRMKSSTSRIIALISERFMKALL